MRRAIIDLGTNTFNLLIAEIATRRVLFQTKEGVALGMDGINENRIGDAAMTRAFAASNISGNYAFNGKLISYVQSGHPHSEMPPIQLSSS